MKAIIETGGKQYYVTEKDVIYVEKLDKDVNDEVVFDKVLMIDGEVGNPTLAGAKVTAKVLKQGKNPDIFLSSAKNSSAREQTNVFGY